MQDEVVVIFYVLYHMSIMVIRWSARFDYQRMSILGNVGCVLSRMIWFNITNVSLS